ncbi:MAG: hypothetical protein U1F43_05245 [Myxococcota bacterium]
MPKPLRPADVLQGRVRPRRGPWWRLIALVNPTARGLDPAETERRYAQKSALQSLLLRWYGDDFVAEPGESDGVVLLRHRHFDECACHARVASLDDDARAWVYQNTESIGAPSAAGADVRAPSRPGARRPLDPLAAAAAALAEYDFEAAEAAYRDGLREPLRALAASRGLLALLVDTLARDEDALAVELPAGAVDDAELRVLHGFALARRGALDEALLRVLAIDHARAGEVEVEVGRRALAAGDLERARLALGRARGRRPPPSGLAGLEAAVGAALKLQAADRETRLAALVASDAAAAERLARAMLDEGVPSALAKQIVRERALSRAAAEEAARAAELTRKKAEQEAAERRAVARVVEGLAATERGTVEQAWADFLTLPEPLRSAVRRARPEDLATLELVTLIAAELPARRLGEVPTRVRRVLESEALWQAEGPALDAAKRVATTLAGLPELSRVARVRATLDEAARVLAQAYWGDVKARVAEAREALEDGAWAKCLATLAELGRRHPSASLRENLAAMQGVAERMLAKEQLVARGEAPEARLDEIDAAREEIRRLADLEGAKPTLRSAAAARADGLDRRLAERLDLVVYDVPPGARPSIDDEQGLRAQSWRVSDQGEIWLVCSPRARAWVTETRPSFGADRGVDESAPASLEVVRRFSFALGPDRRVLDLAVLGDVLWFVLDDGAVIALDRRDPRRVLWTTAPAPDPRSVGRVAVAADASTYVVEHTGKRGTRSLRLADITGRARLVLPAAAVFGYFGAVGTPRLLVAGAASVDWAVYDSDGVQLADASRFQRQPAFAPFVPFVFAAVGRDAGYLALAWDRRELASEDEHLPLNGYLHLVRTDARFEPLAATRVPQPAHRLGGWLYVVPGPAALAMVVINTGTTSSCELFDIEGLAHFGSHTILPDSAWPLQRRNGSALGFLERDNQQLMLTRLPMAAHWLTGPGPHRFPGGMVAPACVCSLDPDRFARRLFEDAVEPRLAKAFACQIERLRRWTFDRALAAAGATDTLEHMWSVSGPHVQMLLYWTEPEPDKTSFFFGGAAVALSSLPGDGEVGERLRRACAGCPDGASEAHALHLLGLHHLQAGRREEAIAAWREGQAAADVACPFKLLIALAGGRVEGVDAAAEEAFSRLGGQYQEALECLARLDGHLLAGRGADGWAEAERVRALVGPSWQLQARVVSLHLDFPELSSDRWRREVDLAWLGSGRWYQRDWAHMVFAGLDWDWRRLAALTHRARAALGWPAMELGDEPAEAADASPPDASGDAAIADEAPVDGLADPLPMG